MVDIFKPRAVFFNAPLRVIFALEGVGFSQINPKRNYSCSSSNAFVISFIATFTSDFRVIHLNFY